MKTEEKKTTKKENKVIQFPPEKEKRRQIKKNLVHQANNTISNVNQKTITSSSKTL